MATPLLVIDVERGFLNAFTRHVPQRIARLITAGLQAHLAGLAVLARNIGAQQLHEAGLVRARLALRWSRVSPNPPIPAQRQR